MTATTSGSCGFSPEALARLWADPTLAAVPAAPSEEVVVEVSDTGAGIPPEVFRYRLGNRSALDWVIDQYQVKPINGPGGDRVSNPNRPDNPEYIVRLVGQVVRVSVETVKIVGGLPPAFGWPQRETINQA